MVILVTLKGNFFYFLVFSKILGFSTMTLSSRFSDPIFRLLLDYIQHEQVKRLDFGCSMKTLIATKSKILN